MSESPKSHRKSNGRRATLRVLYAIDLADLSPEEALTDVRHTLAQADEDPREVWDLVENLTRGVMTELERLDDEIRTLSPNWRIERMAGVDRNILRLGIYEILQELTPPLIVINACVELAKEFGAASTPGFINGLLDQLCQNHEIKIEASSA